MDMAYVWTGWPPILHTLLIGVVGYIVLLLIVRGTGPRTMAKVTPLDFVVAVTIGSAFGRTMTASDASLVQVLFALVLLVSLQWLFATLRARWRWFRRIVDTEPVLLYYDGQMHQRSLRRHRLTAADVHAVARASGLGSLASARAVILHQDGTLGVITDDSVGDGSSLLPYVGPHHR